MIDSGIKDLLLYVMCTCERETCGFERGPRIVKVN